MPVDNSSSSQIDSVSTQLATQTALLHRIASVKWQSALQSRAGYIMYLRTAYQYVLASAPLLRAAAETDFISSQSEIRDYLLRHAVEEDGEDKWLIEDLQALGVQCCTSDYYSLFEPVIAMVGTQYYRIFHRCPASIFGYMYALESAPPTPLFLEKLARDLGLPKTAMRSLWAHARNDLLHRDEICRIVDSLALSPSCLREILQAARYTLLRLIDSYNQILHMGKEAH